MKKKKIISPKISSSQFFNFFPKVFLVEGHTNHCIYDLNKSRLYCFGKDVMDLMTKLVHNKNYFLKLNPQEKEALQIFINHQVLKPSPQKEIPPKIQSLAKPHKIDFVWIELTQQCNHQCIFCYEKSSPHNTKKMSFKDFCTAIDNLKDFEIKKIQLIGGEPLLLGSQLKKMIQYCGNDFDYLEIFTNATLINEDWCKFFQKNNIRIALSLHSYNPTQHDKVTQKKGSGKATQKAIELLTKHYIKFRIATVKTKYNQLGKKPNKSPYQLKIDNARLTEREDFKLYNFAMFKSKAITKERLKSQLQEKRIIERISGHPCFSQKLYISHNLDVYPCVMERRFLHGNIKKQKLIKIIKPAIQSLSKDKIETCKICEFRYACHDCRPDSMGADKLQKPWYCSYDPVTGTWEDLKKMFKRLK